MSIFEDRKKNGSSFGSSSNSESKKEDCVENKRNNSQEFGYGTIENSKDNNFRENQKESNNGKKYGKSNLFNGKHIISLNTENKKTDFIFVREGNPQKTEPRKCCKKIQRYRKRCSETIENEEKPYDVTKSDGTLEKYYYRFTKESINQSIHACTRNKEHKGSENFHEEPIKCTEKIHNIGKGEQKEHGLEYVQKQRKTHEKSFGGGDRDGEKGRRRKIEEREISKVGEQEDEGKREIRMEQKAVDRRRRN